MANTHSNGAHVTALTDDTLHLQGRPIQCNHCEHYCHPQDNSCPKCGNTLANRKRETDNLSRATQFSLSKTSVLENVEFLAPNALMVVQFLPSNICIPLSLDFPVILGRKVEAAEPPEHPIINLSALNASELGVSRCHCQLERFGSHIVATDLGSRNCSYLNNKVMKPHQEYLLAHDDQLILGRLYMNILFSLDVASG